MTLNGSVARDRVRLGLRNNVANRTIEYEPERSQRASA